jgi:hypothetical protein
METLTVQGEVTREGLLKIEVPSKLRPGPVQVTLTIHESPKAGTGAASRLGCPVRTRA